MAGEASDTPVTTEVEELDEEQFEIPADLVDEPDYGAPAPDTDDDTTKGGPPSGVPDPTKTREHEGRFTEKPKEEAPKEAPAARAGQPPVEIPAEGSEKPATTEAAAPGEEEEEPELEFSFRADGQPVTIKGSKITKDFVMIPRNNMADVQRLLSHGVTYQGSFRQRLTESARAVAEAKAEVQEDVIRAKATLEFIAKKLDEGPDAVQDWLDEFQQNRVKLEAEATLAVAKAHREHKPVGDVQAPGFEEEVNEFSAGVDREEMVNTLSADLVAFVPAALRELQIRGLTGDEVGALISELSDPDEIDRYFGIAGEDMPEFGVTKGQVVRKDAVIAKVLKRRAGLLLGARKNGSELEAAKLKNDRPKPANPIPPTTTSQGGAPGKAKKPLPKTKEELDAWMDDDEAEAT
jgi:transposase-like protein